MTQQVSPIAIRRGQTQTWINNLSYLLTNKFWSSKRLYIVSGNLVPSLVSKGFYYYYLIYYPFVHHRQYRKRFVYPRFYRHFLVLKAASIDLLGFHKLIDIIWTRGLRRYIERFVRSAPVVRVNRWFSKQIMRGLGSNQHKLCSITKYIKKHLKRKKSPKKYMYLNFYLAKLVRAAKKLYWTLSWRQSRRQFLNSYFSRTISYYLNMPVRGYAINMFEYLVRKKLMTYRLHQQHLWGYQYKNERFKYPFYYDILNILLVQVFFINTDMLLLQVINLSLFRMDRLNIRIKPFLFFISRLLKILTIVKLTFKIFRVNIEGKLRGGTSRTSAFSAGYGVPAINSTGNLLRFSFRSLRSKYGAYGLKIFSQRH